MPINTSMMKKLIEYMYTGYTRVHKDEIQKFLHHVKEDKIPFRYWAGKLDMTKLFRKSPCKRVQ